MKPKKRLGATRGAAEIKQHAFFRKIDFIHLAQLKLKPPFNFESEPINLQGFDANINKNMPLQSLTEDKGPQGNFQGFTYQKSLNMMSPQTLQNNIQSSKNFVITQEYMCQG